MAEKKTGMQQGSQMRITAVERQILRNTFKGNEELIRLMRKLFLPEIDPYAPLGQAVDLWMTVDIKDQNPEQVYVNLLARNQLITHVDHRLMEIKTLAETDEKDLEPKNSSK